MKFGFIMASGLPLESNFAGIPVEVDDEGSREGTVEVETLEELMRIASADGGALILPSDDGCLPTVVIRDDHLDAF